MLSTSKRFSVKMFPPLHEELIATQSDLGHGQPATTHINGKLVVFDVLDGIFFESIPKRHTICPVCGTKRECGVLYTLVDLEGVEVTGIGSNCLLEKILKLVCVRGISSKSLDTHAVKIARKQEQPQMQDQSLSGHDYLRFLGYEWVPTALRTDATLFGVPLTKRLKRVIDGKAQLSAEDFATLKRVNDERNKPELKREEARRFPQRMPTSNASLMSAGSKSESGLGRLDPKAWDAYLLNQRLQIPAKNWHRLDRLWTTVISMELVRTIGEKFGSRTPLNVEEIRSAKQVSGKLNWSVNTGKLRGTKSHARSYTEAKNPFIRYTESPSMTAGSGEISERHNYLELAGQLRAEFYRLGHHSSADQLVEMGPALEDWIKQLIDPVKVEVNRMQTWEVAKYLVENALAVLNDV